MLVSLLMCALANPALASDLEDAEALAREGVELQNVGKETKALPKFEQAYAKSKSAKHLAQVGLCLQAIGRWVESEEALSTALQDANAPWISANRQVIKHALATVKQQVGTLEVTGSPEGAAILVDGYDMGRLPLPAALRLNQGPVVLEVRAAGHRPERQELSVQGGHYRRLQVTLQPMATTPKLPAAVPDAPAEHSSGRIATGSAAEAEQRGVAKKWILLGGVAGVVGVAVIGVLLMMSFGSEQSQR